VYWCVMDSFGGMEKCPKHTKKNEFCNGFTGKSYWFIMLFYWKPLEFMSWFLLGFYCFLAGFKFVLIFIFFKLYQPCLSQSFPRINLFLALNITCAVLN